MKQLILHSKLLITIDAKEKPEEKTVVAVQQPTDQVEALTKKVTPVTEQVAAITTNQWNTHQPARLLVCSYCN